MWDKGVELNGFFFLLLRKVLTYKIFNFIFQYFLFAGNRKLALKNISKIKLLSLSLTHLKGCKIKVPDRGLAVNRFLIFSWKLGRNKN